MQHLSAVCFGNHAAKHAPMRCMYVQRAGIDLPCAPSLCCIQQFWLVPSKKASGVQGCRRTVFCTRHGNLLILDCDQGDELLADCKPDSATWSAVPHCTPLDVFPAHTGAGTFL